MIKIFTKELAESKLFPESQFIIVDAEDNDSLIHHMLNIKNSTNSIEIWDLTKGYNSGDIFEVSDHINKTGSNPLFGNQQKLGIDFPDITNLYQDKTGVVTSCHGNRFFETDEKNSSTWICHISIVARAIGIQNIHGKLVST